MNNNLTIITDAYGLIQVSGRDALKLLQGQLTCDLTTINSTTSSFGAHCSPQGRILFFMRIFYFANAYYLVMPVNMVNLALTCLNKYAIFYQVKLAHLTQPPLLEHTLATQQWRFFNPKLGVAQIYPATSNQFFPHELNLAQLNALAWHKGCYTGQEIIARMHYRGKIKTHLYHATVTSLKPPEYGMILHNSDNWRVVDYCQLSNNCYYLLVLGYQQQSCNNLALYHPARERWIWH